MTENEKAKLIREYAAGEVTWRALQERGFHNYVQVLGALGELGLRPPVAPIEGPNVETRQRGRALIREALRAQKCASVSEIAGSRAPGRISACYHSVTASTQAPVLRDDRRLRTRQVWQEGKGVISADCLKLGGR